MDSDICKDTGGACGDEDCEKDTCACIESDVCCREVSKQTTHRTVEVDYENLMKLVEYADEMAKHIWHFCGVVPENENEESLLLLYSYQNFRGPANANYGEGKAPTLQEMPESESRKQDNPEMPTNT